MKKIFSLVFCGILASSIGTTAIYAQESNTERVPYGFDSATQYEQTPDYYDAERVAAREAKYKQADSVLKQKKNVYSISLPLRAQKYSGWCGAAVAEMIVDYQLGSNNAYTQDKLAGMMKMDKYSDGSYVTDQAETLRTATKLNYEVTRTSDYSFANALRADINSYAGLSLPVDLYYIYNGRPHSGSIGHSLAAKGYSDANTVIFLDPWNLSGNTYGQHEVSINAMLSAINNFAGIYIW